MTRLIVLIELCAVVATAALAYVWYRDPTGNWEPIVVLAGLLGGGSAVDLLRRTWEARSSPRFGSDGDKIRRRESLRQRFTEEIYRCRAEGLRQDVIVRDVDRVDHYPSLDGEETGISSWFKVGLLDTYDKGVVVCLRIGKLKECTGGFRFRDYVNDEEGDLRAWLMGDIPYDSIAEVNMDGDEYYYLPHIYCHFDNGGEPYARLWFAERIDQPHGHPYFRQIANHAEVVANNIDDGTLGFA